MIFYIVVHQHPRGSQNRGLTSSRSTLTTHQQSSWRSNCINMRPSQRLSSEEQSSHVLTQLDGGQTDELLHLVHYSSGGRVDQALGITIGSPSDLMVSLAHANLRFRPALTRKADVGMEVFAECFHWGNGVLMTMLQRFR